MVVIEAKSLWNPTHDFVMNGAPVMVVIEAKSLWSPTHDFVMNGALVMHGLPLMTSS